MTDPSRTTRRLSESAEVNSTPATAHHNEASGGRQRRGGRAPRGGSHRCGNHYRPPLVAPYSELSTAPVGRRLLKEDGLLNGVAGRGVVHREDLLEDLLVTCRDNPMKISLRFLMQIFVPEVPVEEGYGCPPSYLMESYREESDRQEVAVAAAMLNRGRRGGKQIFPAEVPVEEGYGCPPSYLMESYREESDRQEVAVAAAMLNRGRRGGKQIFPGRRRGQSYYHNNIGTTHITQHRMRDQHDDNSFDTLRGIVDSVTSNCDFKHILTTDR
uniref:Retrotransposon protein n=1 Tax=Ascaris lumbricoides TaxID=6252 RepID=A0A0M3IP15_ASCLU